MATRVKLKDLVDALDIQGTDLTTYFDRITGDIIEIPNDTGLIREEAAESMQSVMEDESGRYARLPDSFELNEWAIMRDFCLPLPPQVGEEFLTAIHGRGAFRAFRNALFRHDLEDKWYDFKRARFAEIAREWCEDNDIAVEE